MSELRVLHVAQPTDGGVGRYVATIAAAQRDAGLEVAVASPPGWLADELGATGAEWLAWPARRSPGLSSLREVVRLRRLIAHWRPDVVHLHSSKAGLAGRLAIRGRHPTIFQPHAWSFYVGGSAARLALRWERVATRYADAIVCVSDAERVEAEAHGIGGRFRVIENGVDVDRFQPARDEERVALRSRLELPRAAPVVVCAGRLAHQKGQDLLLEAWPHVLLVVPEALLVLVGDGPLREELGHAAGESVRLVGHRSDVGSWLQVADIVVLPSRWEGFSLLLLEAMACGVAVVASDVGGVGESLALAVPNAVVPVEDVGSLVAAISDRLAAPELAQEEGRKNRAIVLDRFDERRVIADVLRLTHELGGMAG